MQAARGNICEQCGLPIPTSDLGSRCPNCLLELAITPLPLEPENLPPTPLRHTPLKSRFFADYEIAGEIARGGMGVVYRARQLSLDRSVALKLVQSGLLGSTDALLRFQVEVRAVAQLNHPNIVSLYEAGEHEGQHYFSMGLVEGRNLAELSAGCTTRGPDWLRRAAGLLVKIARAVHHAHQRGILHRDLKPSNILIDEGGEPHVTDFGLAKMLERDSDLTHTQSIVGSPNYMAPEQAAGHSNEVTTAADVYSLGTILYELVTGRPPFQAGTALETMRLVAEKEPTPPRKLNPAIDANLETICLKCLRKEAEARYSSAEELAHDLECWLQGRSIRARPVGALGSLWLWSRRHPAVALLSLALMLALIGIAIGSSIAVVRVTRAERRATANLRDSLLNQTRALRLTSLIGNRTESLKQIGQASALGGSPEFRRQLRDELLAALARTDLKFMPQPQLPCSSDPALNLLAPQFDRWATVTNGRTVRIVTVPDGRELQRFDAGESAVQALESFSDNGRFLGIRHADAFTVWDVNTGQRCFATNDATTVFCFTLDNTGLVVQIARKAAAVLELPSMKEMRQLKPYADSDRDPAVSWISMACSPDGRTLAAQGWSTRLTGLIDLETGTIKGSATNFGVGRTLAWSGDSKYLAVANHRHRVSVWNATSASQAFGSAGFPAEARTLALNASASLVAAGFEDEVLRLFDVDATRLAAEFPCVTHRVAFDPKGTRIGPVFRNGIAGWLELERSSEFLETAVTDTAVQLREMQWSPDGRIVAVGTDTNVVLCDSATGRVLLTMKGSRIKTTCFDPQEPFVVTERGAAFFRRKLNWRNGRLALGKLEELRPSAVSNVAWRSLSFSPKGDVLIGAYSPSNCAIIFDRTLTNKVAELGPHQRVDFVDISADSRWVATGSSQDRHLRIWDTTTSREVLAVPAAFRPRAVFSPDGKWVAISGKTFELREVGGSWKPAPLPRLGEREPVLSVAAFSPDSRILAVVADQGSVQLIDLDTLQPLGLFQPPGYVPINGVSFSADGSRLITVGDAARLRIWNLTLLRKRLAEYSLDWSPPS